MKPPCLRAVLAFAFVVGTVGAARASVIDFETVALGVADPFAVTAGTTTATFSSPGVFTIGNSFLSNMSGHILFDADPAINPLVVSFDQGLSGISLNFALNTANAATLFTLQAFSGGIGGTLVGSTALAGIIPGGGFSFPEGVIGFSGAVFDTVRLSTTSQDFAIDNVSFTPAAVPEPASILLLGTGALGLIAKLRRRKQQNS
jgi:hypothetical protein